MSRLARKPNSLYKKYFYFVGIVLIILIILSLFTISYFVPSIINKYFDLEEQRLDLERQRLNMQAYHTNRSLELQAAQERANALEIVMNSPIIETAVTDLSAQERVKILEIVMNSPVIETAVTGLFDTPKEASNILVSSIETLGNILKINYNVNTQLGSLNSILNVSKNESKNTPRNISEEEKLATSKGDAVRYVQVNLLDGTSVGGKYVSETPAFTTIAVTYTLDPHAYILDYRMGTPFSIKDPNKYIAEAMQENVSIRNDLIYSMIEIQDPKAVLEGIRQQLKDEAEALNKSMEEKAKNNRR